MAAPIPADGVLELPMRRMLEIGKQLAPSHDLAQALWGPAASG